MAEKKLTFAGFQATRVWHDDLTDCPYYWADKADGPCPGYAYVEDDGGLFIDRLADGTYQLVIANMDYVSAELHDLERKLYRFGVEEGWFSWDAPLGDPETAVRLSERFAELLHEDLTPAQFAAMVTRNRVETSKGVCHSHDFCDANVTMADAWRQVIGDDFDADDEAQTAVWNEAWELAHSRGLIA